MKLKLIRFYQVSGDVKIPQNTLGDFKEFSALNSTYTPPYDQNENSKFRT